MTPRQMKIHMDGKLRRHSIAFAFLMLSIGVILALFMIEQEVNNRIRDTNSVRAAQIRANRKAIAKLSVTNEKQDKIIFALLKIREKSPNLFDGVSIPTATQYRKQIGEPVKQSDVVKPGKGRPKPKPVAAVKPPVYAVSNEQVGPQAPGQTITPTTPTPTTPQPICVTVLVLRNCLE